MKFFKSLRIVTVLMLAICQPIFAEPTCDNALASIESVLSVRFDAAKKAYVTTYLISGTFRSAEFVTKTFRTEHRAGLPKGWSAEEYQAADELYLDKVLPLIRMANDKFEKRRGWGTSLVGENEIRNSFSLKNLDVAKTHLTDSSYVLVEDHKGNLLGGIRNIQILNQSGKILPEEKFLNINLPPMGLAATKPDMDHWKNEIGTYCVEETLSAEMRHKIILEIWNNLFQFMFSKQSVSDNMYNQGFHTYGDRKSMHMYLPLGFQKLRIYRHGGKLVNYSNLPDRQIPPLIIDGQPWWPLVMLPHAAKELNEKFSSRGLPMVDANWLPNRRRQMSDPEVGLLQLGALFPHLLQDLNSNEERVFLSALSGLADLLESAPKHMEVLQSSLGNPSVTEVGIAEVIKIRDQLAELFYHFDERVARMSEARRLSMVMFVGSILAFQQKSFNYIPMSTFYQKTVFTLLADPSIQVIQATVQYLSRVRSPKQWLEETGEVWDLSIPELSGARYVDPPGAEKVFLDQVREAELVLTKRLMDLEITKSDLDRTVSKLQAALFKVPVRIDLGFSASRLDTSAATSATLALIKLRQRDRDQIAMLIKLAAARQYLADARK